MTLTKQQKYNRERRAMNVWLNRDKEYDQALEFMHKEAVARIQKQIDTYYMRYAGREGIPLKEAKKRASDMDVREWANMAKKAVREKDFSPEANAWLKVYNLKQNVSRLEVIKAQVNLELLRLHSQQQKYMEQALYEDVEAEIRRQERIIAESRPQTGVLGMSSTYDSAHVKGIVNGDFYGANFSERIWGRNGQYDQIRKEVFKSLSQMNIDMEGYRKERNRLMKKFETKKYEAMRLIKTEAARVRAETQLDMLKNNEFTHLIYVAEPDACSRCASLDGLAIPIDQAEMGLNLYPMHPNCRCSTYGHVEMSYKDGKTTLSGYEMWEDSSFRRDVNGIIKVDKVIKGHKPPGREGEPNTVVQHEKNGKILNRTYYSSRGLIKKGIDFTHHNRPDKHPYGIKGEHVHEYEWDNHGKRKDRVTRELTEQERKENRDVL